MIARAGITRLLVWLKDNGLEPSHPQEQDRYLDPTTQRIKLGKDLSEYQRRTSFWIPSARTLRLMGLPVTLERHEGLVLAEVAGVLGVGVTTESALLSVFNRIRT